MLFNEYLFSQLVQVKEYDELNLGMQCHHKNVIFMFCVCVYYVMKLFIDLRICRF